jgi:hypothetical protein
VVALQPDETGRSWLGGEGGVGSGGDGWGRGEGEEGGGMVMSPPRSMPSE